MRHYLASWLLLEARFLVQMERNTVSQAHEALQAAHEALQAEAQRQSDTAAEQRREAAARDEVKDAEEVAAVAELHSRMSELQVQGFAFSPFFDTAGGCEQRRSFSILHSIASTALIVPELFASFNSIAVKTITTGVRAWSDSAGLYNSRGCLPHS